MSAPCSQLAEARADPSINATKLSLNDTKADRSALLRLVQQLLDGALGASVEEIGDGWLGLPGLFEVRGAHMACRRVACGHFGYGAPWRVVS